MKWAYGITTVPERQYSYFPKTIQSLRKAGFTHPLVFVDGSMGDYSKYNLPVIYRGEKILAYGNWLLSLLELWIRNPQAERFALFQDDFVTYKNLKSYLDTCVLPDNQYWNLYTFPQNETIKPEIQGTGWYKSNQRGRGAVALVFGREVVFKLLTSESMMAKPRVAKNPHRSIDGIVVTSMTKVNIKEVVHYPTLIQHIGDCSSIGNRQHQKPTSFLGEDFDAMNFDGKVLDPTLTG